MENQEKELDLLALFKMFTDWVKKVIRWLTNNFLLFVSFNIKNWIIILIIIVLGISLSIYKSQPQHRKYYAEFLLEVKGTSNFIVKDMLEVVFDQIDDDNKLKKESLLKTIHLTEDDVDKIYDAGLFYAIDLNNNGNIDFIDYSDSFKEDSVNVKISDLLDVVICTRGELDYQNLQEKLISYLNHNTDLLKGRTTWVKKTNSMISTLDVEISTLDSLRNAQIKKTGSGVMTAGLGKDNILVQTSYYQDMIGLKSKKMELQEELNNSSAAVFPHSSVRVKKVDTKPFIFFKWIGFCYGIGLFLILVVRKRKNISNFVRKQKNAK